MPQIPKYDLEPLDLGEETVGQRLSKLRKARGLTQVDLANTIGIRQVLVSDYERGRLRPNCEMIVRFAMALDVTTDEILGLKNSKKNDHHQLSLQIIRRAKKIEELPDPQKRTLLKTIDTFLKGAQGEAIQ